MIEMTTGAIDMASIAITAVMVVMSLIAWFFVNRISVRANQQIKLLESLLAEQKRQNQLLYRLTDSLTGEDGAGKGATSGVSQGYTRLIPER